MALKPLSLGISFARFLQWVSAIIVMGITSFFLAKHTHSQHNIYQEVIAVLTVALYLPALVTPFLTSYKHQFSWLDLIFSHLWLVAFVFAAQDYNWRDCRFHAPPDYHKCTLKKTNEGFIFLAFFFTLVGLALEHYAWRKLPRDATTTPTRLEKTDPARPSADTAV